MLALSLCGSLTSFANMKNCPYLLLFVLFEEGNPNTDYCRLSVRLSRQHRLLYCKPILISFGTNIALSAWSQLPTLADNVTLLAFAA